MILKRLGNLSSREKIALSAGGFMMFLFLTDFLIVGRITNAFSSLNDQIWAAEQKLRMNYGVLDARKEVESEYNRVSGLLATATSSSIASEDMSLEVDDIASKYELNSDSISVREPRKHPKGYYEEYTVDIGEFNTGIDNLLNFLHEIRMSPGMLRVSELTVKPVKDSTAVTGSMVVTKVMKSGAEGIAVGGPGTADLEN